MSEIIEGFEINENDKSTRIVNIDISDEILNKLIFPFNKSSSIFNFIFMAISRQ